MKIPDAVLARLPRGADTLSAAIKRSALTMAWCWVDIIRLEGASAADGRKVTVVVAARSASADFILDRLFDGPVRETSLGRSWVGALPKRLRALKADLTIARVAMGVGDNLFGADFLRVLELVNAEIDVPPVGSRWPFGKSARADRRRVLKNGLTWTVTKDPADFDLFYRDMYAPFVRDRFGERGYASPRDELRYRFAHGCIQWIKHGGETICGRLFQFDGDRLRCVVVGLGENYAVARKTGAIAATKLFAVEYAQQNGFPFVSLGASSASLCDPVLINKRHWGAEIKPRQRASQDLLVRWPVWNPLVAHFLAELAPILRSKNRLVGLTFDRASDVFDEAALRQAGRKFGMKGLAVLGVLGGEPGDIRPGTRIDGDGLPVVALVPGSSQAIWADLRQGGLET